jgi:hypothetical protein
VQEVEDNLSKRTPSCPAQLLIASFFLHLLIMIIIFCQTNPWQGIWTCD